MAACDRLPDCTGVVDDYGLACFLLPDILPGAIPEFSEEPLKKVEYELRTGHDYYSRDGMYTWARHPCLVPGAFPEVAVDVSVLACLLLLLGARGLIAWMRLHASRSYVTLSCDKAITPPMDTEVNP